MNGNEKSWSLLAEAVAIVASILLAFAIDAWWEDRADRVLEQSAIQRLIVEFEQNLDQLDQVRGTHQTALEATERLLALSGPDQDQPIDAEATGKTLLDCLQNPSLDPRLGTTESLIASGDLRLLQDPELQDMLTDWPAAAQNLIRWQEIERMHGEELLAGFSFDYVSWPDVGYSVGAIDRPGAFTSDFRGLLSSLRFNGMLFNRHWNLREIIADIDAMEARTRRLIEKLESQMD